MRTNLFNLICLLTTGILLLSACNMPDSAATAEAIPPTEPAKLSTATIEPSATSTEVPPTETPTITPTETLTPQPSSTSTPEVVTARVGRETNCRIGPGGMYTLVATYQDGQMLEVTARDLGGGYVFVKNPEKPEEQCYLLANNIVVSGDTSVLPQFTPLPSPTAAPYFEVSFKKFETCKDKYFALFTVENVGSIPFRSFYVRVTDSKVDKSVEQVINAFDLWSGCVIAKEVAPLNTGGTGFVYTPYFSWNARANKLQAVIMLCTEKDLKGTCVTRILEVKE